MCGCTEKVIEKDIEIPISTPYVTPTEAPTFISTPEPTLVPTPIPTLEPMYPCSIPLDSPMWQATNRLEIPELQFVVPITDCSIWEAQNYVDMENMAAVFPIGDTVDIADHNNQGFSAIKYCKIGTTCNLIRGDSVEEYKCIEIDNDGLNTGSSIVLSDGRDTDYQGFDIVMYTCNDCWQNITIVAWENNCFDYPETGDGMYLLSCSRPRA